MNHPAASSGVSTTTAKTRTPCGKPQGINDIIKNIFEPIFVPEFRPNLIGIFWGNAVKFNKPLFSRPPETLKSVYVSLPAKNILPCSTLKCL